ncbi:hypothetical protein ACFOZY_06565 [Chungangia koreensis]|uniref:Uncharacterized protein n=1 Tax=Chungangia koreensis TaxID=752657 RepID=A0ABV8X3U0_9LACT
MKTIIVLLFLIILFFFIAGVVFDRRKAVSQKNHNEWLADLPHDHSISSINFSQALLIDESAEVILFLQELDQEEYEYDEIPFYKILEVALIENNQSVYSFPKNSVLLNEGKSAVHDEEMDEEDEYIENLTLKVLVDDLTNPVKEFNCIEEEDYISSETDEYIDAFEECSDWYHKLVILIKRTEKSRTSSKGRIEV